MMDGFEGKRRENVADARQKQISGERLPAEQVRIADLTRVVELSPEAVARQSGIPWKEPEFIQPTLTPEESPMRFYSKAVPPAELEARRVARDFWRQPAPEKVAPAKDATPPRHPRQKR